MQIVVVPAKEIDAMLEGGVGPSLEPDQAGASPPGRLGAHAGRIDYAL